MKIYMDVDQLNAKFWNTALEYTNEDGETVSIPESQILVENGPVQEVDESQPWVRWEVTPGASKRETQGENAFYKNLGTAHLEIHVPKGSGTATAGELRDCILDAFTDWKSDDKSLYVYKTDAPKGKGTKSSHQQNATIFYESMRQS